MPNLLSQMGSRGFGDLSGPLSPAYMYENSGARFVKGGGEKNRQSYRRGAFAELRRSTVLPAPGPRNRGGTAAAPKGGKWVGLFDGKTPEGWKGVEEGCCRGHGKIHAEPGRIVLEKGARISDEMRETPNAKTPNPKQAPTPNSPMAESKPREPQSAPCPLRLAHSALGFGISLGFGA